MSDFHDNYPVYEKMSLHDEAQGKKDRRVLWNVFWIMLFITILELIVGFLAPGNGWTGQLWLKIFFIGFTLIKAAAIVLWFMHLGHEVKFFKYAILAPYCLFMLYTIFIVLTEGVYAGEKARVTRVDKIFVEQQAAFHKAHGTAAPEHSEGGGEHH